VAKRTDRGVECNSPQPNFNKLQRFPGAPHELSLQMGSDLNPMESGKKGRPSSGTRGCRCPTGSREQLACNYGIETLTWLSNLAGRPGNRQGERELGSGFIALHPDVTPVAFGDSLDDRES
jgi:hypothetical protein